MKKVRCAIYTRKSSEEGLEQDFNSLDAQREACSAYILSQTSEGWSLIPEEYDDGGVSGGTLDRPALQRLLAALRAGLIDIIVVYKVDRLTRSLLDFSSLVQSFEEAQVSFVSVTQSFNTTTSMGRLTLNMLLSFAQFEREVTAERIRDKIAASKAKGMWMGGNPPLGYKPRSRSLAIVEDHAALVSDIYRRYLAVGSVRELADCLEQESIVTPQRKTLKGQSYGGVKFSRGQLYTILKNPVYAGDIAHKGAIYPGNHQAIIDRETWGAVQRKLEKGTNGVRRTREANASMLSGLLVDPQGEPLVAVHSTKGKMRYRYYVSKAHHHCKSGTTRKALRLPAEEIERVVAGELRAMFADPISLTERFRLAITPSSFEVLCERCPSLADRLNKPARALLKQLLTRIAVHPKRLEIMFDRSGLAALLAISEPDIVEECLSQDVAISLARTGHTLRYVQDNGALVRSRQSNPGMVRLLAKAHGWWGEMQKGELDIANLARREGITASYVTRVIRLAFLAPNVADGILEGRLRAHVDVSTLLTAGGIEPDWTRQKQRLLPAG